MHTFSVWPVRICRDGLTHNNHLELEHIDTSDPKVARHAISGKGSAAAIYAQQT